MAEVKGAAPRPGEAPEDIQRYNEYDTIVGHQPLRRLIKSVRWWDFLTTLDMSRVADQYIVYGGPFVGLPVLRALIDQRDLQGFKSLLSLVKLDWTREMLWSGSLGLPLRHALVWSIWDIAAVMVRHGAEMTEDMLRSTEKAVPFHPGARAFYAEVCVVLKERTRAALVSCEHLREMPLELLDIVVEYATPGAPPVIDAAAAAFVPTLVLLEPFFRDD